MLLPKRCQWVYFIQFLVLYIQLVLIIIALQGSQRRSFHDQDLITRRSIDSIELSNKVAKKENYMTGIYYEYSSESHHLDTPQNFPNRPLLKPFLTIMIFSRAVRSDLKFVIHVGKLG